MSYTNTTNLELFGDSFESSRFPIQQLSWLQDSNDFVFDTSLSIDNLHACATPVLDSPFKEHLEGFQQLGWYSPPASEYAESLQGDSEEMALPVRSATEDLPASPPVENLAAENAHLKVMVMAMSERLAQLEAAVALKAPAQSQPVHLPVTPRKRRVSRVDILASPPSKRSLPTTPRSIGPIEAMWSPGVTAEQRQVIATSSAFPAAGMSSPGSMMGHQTSTSTPAATLSATLAPKRKQAVKKRCALRVQKTPALKKAPSHKVRPVNELYDLNFATLGAEEKASVLLPLLEGIDPFTGIHFGPSALSHGRNVQAAPATTRPLDDSMTLEDFNALVNWTSGNNHTLNFGQLNHSEGVDGAARQREALEQHQRRTAEGRRR
jgi:hypothetical protein